jgi:polyhydroxyalkanoate synthase subunit PhaC
MAQSRTIPPDTSLNAWHQAQFSWTDVLRRAQGDAFGALGLGPNECPYRVVASGSHWRLRDYADQHASPSLLIVAAPIKRPYIWDIAPSVSAIGFCLRRRLRVYLLEWMPASADNPSEGLDDYTEAIRECVAKVSDEARGEKPFLIGHSLGGTLAAIFAASAAENLRGLVLLGAPLCFQPQTSQFRDALVSLVPPTLSDMTPFPGSLLSHMSALASPDTFIWSRLRDAALSITDYHALDIHARVERWALDEVPLPGRLVHQIIEWLYRENRFWLGTLKVGGTPVGPLNLSVSTLAVVNTADEVAPLASVKPFTDAMPKENARIIEYPGEIGVGFQHLGILVGRQAHARVWPEIFSWLNSLAADAQKPP